MSTLDLGKIKFLWKGTWSAATSYVANDVVAYNSSVWICTQSFSTGVSNEFAPGRRDRTNFAGRTLDPAETLVYNVTVQTYNTVNYFYIDGVRTPSLTLYPNVRYKFLQRDASNLNHRIAFSTAPDGIFGGGTEYTTGVTYTGTAGSDGAVELILISSAPVTLYYYSAQDTNYGGGSSGRITLGSTWRGWQYWDLVTSGITFKNTWSSTTQYYYNDVVEYQGATYIALGDNINKFPLNPGNNHVWLLMMNGDRRSEHNSAAHFMNKGPLDWPYPHGIYADPQAISSLKWISRSGRVYHHGTGYFAHGQGAVGSGSNGGVPAGAPYEVNFNFFDWWNSRDNGGTGRMTTPDGLPPKCIQIEHGYSTAFFLFNNGEVWTVGRNSNGQLGDGTFSDQVISRRVIGLNDIKIVKISASYGNQLDACHVLALDEYGYVWTWGYNGYGQLGHGHTQDLGNPQRIPRSYFGGERIIDIVAGGGQYGWSYVRTSSDNLYSWGLNNIGQLGDASTTNRWRPVKVSGWDPVANNGIKKWQAVQTNQYSAFMILDGNGYLWGVGDDQYGNMGYASTSASRTSFVKSTQSPGGTIVDFWATWADSNWAYKLTFLRTATGATWVCGLGSTGYYVTGLGTNVTAVYPPTQIPAVTKITNVKEVYLQGSQTSADYRTIHFLTDSGQVFSQGAGSTFALNGNPLIGTSNNGVDETGVTYYPHQTFLPPSTKIKQMMMGGYNGTSQIWAAGIFYITDTGQIFGHGIQRNAAGARQTYHTQNFIMYSQSPGEVGAIYTPVSLTYAR